MLNEPRVLQAMRRHHLFQRLPDEAMAAVCGGAALRQLAPGQPLFHQGETAERFYFLLEGQVKLHRIISGGTDKLVEVIRPGQSFAEALFFTDVRTYPVTATALKDSVVASVDGAQYRRLLEENPQTCLDILATLSLRLHQRLNEIDTLTLANASQRVVRFLLLELESGHGDINLDIPRQLIASRLGIQPETFSRILHRFADTGLIQLDNRRIQIIDRDGLEAFNN